MVSNTDVIIEEKMMQMGQAYAKSLKSFLLIRETNGVKFYVFAGDKIDPVTPADIDKFENHDYESFDDYKARAFGMHRVMFGQDTNDWIHNVECTCPSFGKKYMCKHVNAFATKLKLIQVADKFDEPMTRKVRGRPKKATPALQTD